MARATGTGSAIAALALCLAAASCGDSGPDNLQVSLRVPAPRSRSVGAVYTDAAAIRITVAGVRVHSSGYATPGDPGWVPCDSGKPFRVDLLELAGDRRGLCLDRVAAGYYRQVRVDLAENASDGSPPVNTVTTRGGEELPLEVADGGFGAIVGFLADGGRVEAVLDLDASTALHLSPAGRLIFRPYVLGSSTTVYGPVSR